MKINCIPALQDNYIWIITNLNNNKAIVFDPGESEPVENFLKINKLELLAIMLTHHHNDHVGGVKQLTINHSNIIVYGPKETYDKGTTNIVNEGDIITLLKYNFHVISTPGHTLGHISYYISPYIFCGDTMFSGGCGKLIEGNSKQMYDSFNKINKLPKKTLICSAHEYTLSNMSFAISIIPNDLYIINYYKYIKKLRLLKKITLPTKLSKERKINIFLRIEEKCLLQSLNINDKKLNPWIIFSILRQKKDNFKF